MSHRRASNRNGRKCHRRCYGAGKPPRFVERMAGMQHWASLLSQSFIRDNRAPPRFALGALEAREVSPVFRSELVDTSADFCSKLGGGCSLRCNPGMAALRTESGGPGLRAEQEPARR